MTSLVQCLPPPMTSFWPYVQYPNIYIEIHWLLAAWKLSMIGVWLRVSYGKRAKEQRSWDTNFLNFKFFIMLKETLYKWAWDCLTLNICSLQSFQEKLECPSWSQKVWRPIIHFICDQTLKSHNLAARDLKLWICSLNILNNFMCTNIGVRTPWFWIDFFWGEGRLDRFLDSIYPFEMIQCIMTFISCSFMLILTNE